MLMCACVCFCMWTHVCMCIVFKWMNTGLCVCVFICLHVYVCIYVLVFECGHECLYVCVYTYVHSTWRFNPSHKVDAWWLDYLLLAPQLYLCASNHFQVSHSHHVHHHSLPSRGWTPWIETFLPWNQRDKIGWVFCEDQFFSLSTTSNREATFCLSFI